MSESSHTPKRLLVTGGAGFIGTNFVHHWLERHQPERLVVLDALTYAGHPANLERHHADPAFRLVEGSITDAALVDRLFREENFDTVVHFAAESHVDRSIEGPLAFVDTNISGTAILLEAARKHWRDASGSRRFHHISTDEVYGELGDEGLFSHDSSYAPNSPYAASKAGADMLARAWHRTYGLPVVVTNCSNNYGPWQFPEKLIPVIILNALEQQPLPVYGEGRQVRDWLHVADHCQAVDRVLHEGQLGETYLVGGNSELSNIELVRLICQLLDDRRPRSTGGSYADLIHFVTDRPGHDFRYAIDASRLRDELGWTPRWALAKGLAETVDWYLANQAWCELVAQSAHRQRRGLQEQSKHERPG